MKKTLIICICIVLWVGLPIENPKPVNGYVSPAQVLHIPLSCGMATIDAVRDSSYPSTPTWNGTGANTLDIWSYHDTSYLYIYLEVPGDTVSEGLDDDTDFLTIICEHDHDNTLEAGDTLVHQMGVGSDSFMSEVFSGTVWDINPNDFDGVMADGYGDGNVRTWECKLNTTDCGWDTAPEGECGLKIHYFDENGSGDHVWPNGGGNSWTTIATFGECIGDMAPSINQLAVGVANMKATNTTIVTTLFVQDDFGNAVESVTLDIFNGSQIWQGLTNAVGEYNLTLAYTPKQFTLAVNASKNGYIIDQENFTIYIDPPAVNYQAPVGEYDSSIFGVLGMVSLPLIGLLIGVQVLQMKSDRRSD